MTQRLDGFTGKYKVFHITGSSQWILVMLYIRVKHTKDSIYDTVQALQIDCNAHGADECAGNIHVDDE